MCCRFVDSLTIYFEDFSMKETSAGKFIRAQGGFSFKKKKKKVTFRLVARHDEERTAKGAALTVTDMDYLSRCVSLNESGVNINMRPSPALFKLGKPAIIKTSLTKSVTHTMLGIISALGIIEIE
jgi:hypothetical protein